MQNSDRGFNRRRLLQTAAIALAGGALMPQQLLAREGSSPIRARLSLNENPFGPSPLVADALNRQSALLSRYTGEEANELIRLIARQERVPEDQIILGEILEPLGLQLAVGKGGGEVVYANPGYTALVDAAATVGGKGIAVPLNAQHENDLPALAARVNERTLAVFLVNPHNPTGTVSDPDRLRTFLRETSRRTLVIVDEAYLEFVDDFATRSIVDLVREGHNIIVFRTFAKVYGLAGLDIGYGIVPRPIGEQLRKQGLGNPRLLNRLGVAAAAASLRDTGYVARIRSAVAAERALWNDLLRDLKVEHSEARGNFVFFNTGRPHAQFASELLQDGVEIARQFPPYDQWARISIGLPAENKLARDSVQRLLAKPARS